MIRPQRVGNGLWSMDEEEIMKTITAKILDPIHLELSQPISARPGESILISIPDEDEEDRSWREVAKKHFLDAYAKLPRGTTVEDVLGCTGYKGPRKSLEDMEAAIAKGARGGR